MKVLFDTNVILDVLLDREPFAEDAAVLLSKVERAEIIGFACATTITTIHYLLSKYLEQERAAAGIQTIMALFEIAPVNRLILEKAMDSNFPDFEDSVLYQAAKYADVNCIITRNSKDFKKSSIPVYTPTEYLSALQIIYTNKKQEK